MCDERTAVSSVREDLVSVVIPTFNREKLVGRALDSVRRQHYRPLEIIVVDDGSSDGTESVVREWADRFADPILSVEYIKQRNAGAPAARNMGVVSSRGAFIQYLDSDDVLSPRKIFEQVKALRSFPGAMFAWSGFTSAESYSEHLFSDEGKPWHFHVAKCGDVPAMVVCGLFRRSACELIGAWNEKLQRYQDWEYSVRYVSLGKTSLRSSDVGYGVIKDANDRIDNLGRNSNEKMSLLQAAAEAAETSVILNTREARLKIGMMYSQAMLVAFALQDRGRARLFYTKMRRLVPRYTPVYIKNTAIYLVSCVIGMDGAVKLSRIRHLTARGRA